MSANLKIINHAITQYINNSNQTLSLLLWSVLDGVKGAFWSEYLTRYSVLLNSDWESKLFSAFYPSLRSCFFFAMASCLRWWSLVYLFAYALPMQVAEMRLIYFWSFSERCISPSMLFLLELLIDRDRDLFVYDETWDQKLFLTVVFSSDISLWLSLVLSLVLDYMNLKIAIIPSFIVSEIGLGL